MHAQARFAPSGRSPAPQPATSAPGQCAPRATGAMTSTAPRERRVAHARRDILATVVRPRDALPREPPPRSFEILPNNRRASRSDTPVPPRRSPRAPRITSTRCSTRSSVSRQTRRARVATSWSPRTLSFARAPPTRARSTRARRRRSPRWRTSPRASPPRTTPTPTRARVGPPPPTRRRAPRTSRSPPPPPRSATRTPRRPDASPSRLA